MRQKRPEISFFSPKSLGTPVLKMARNDPYWKIDAFWEVKCLIDKYVLAAVGSSQLLVK